MPRQPLDLRLNRRTLLRGGLGLAGGLVAARTGLRGLLPLAHAADDLEDRYFIFCYFSGGWDLLMGLDPRDPALFRDDLRKVTRIQPGYDQLSSSYRDLVETSVEGMVFGPAIGDLARHADKLCVVRGISMDTLTHEVGRRRFITGHPPAGLQAQGSAMSTVLAGWLGEAQPVPQLSVRVESYNADQPGFASAIRVQSVDDLVRALRPGTHSVGSGEQAAIDALLADFEACDSVAGDPFYASALGHRAGSKTLVEQGLDTRFDFAANTAEMEALRDLYGIDADDLTSAAAQAASAVTAITSGISRTVCVMPAESLDSHGPEWASLHAPRMEAGFDLVAAMIDDLASREYQGTGESWLDRTCILGFSEFGRSPLLNSSGGRDHFLHNACVLAGGGVAAGRVIGASSDVGMSPTAMDLETGLPDEGGETVRPEHIFRALLEGIGLTDDVAEFGVEPLRAVLA